jgi:hypothetical protein
LTPSSLPPIAARALLLFDTNVAAALKTRPQEELNRFWASINAQHRYAIAPIVVAEILKSLRADLEKHLQEARRDLSALHGQGDRIMLPLPHIFLGRTLFNSKREDRYLPAQTMAEVLEAGRRLKRVVRIKGRVVLVEDPEHEAIVLDHIIDPITKAEEATISALERRGSKKPLDEVEWAHLVLQAAGLPATLDAARTLADACKAAYTLQRFLWTHAAKSYNPRKHRGDFIDGQLLLYLAYPKAVLVSREKQLPARIAGSGQENQVKSFDDLWDESQA